MKERNHRCDYCGRMFARKDTLRRHMEDGCSKRFDIGTLDLRLGNCETIHGSGRQLTGDPLSLLGPPSGGLPPMSIATLGSNNNIATNTTPSMRSRDSAVDPSPEHSWGR
ncbi:hypothetical protein NKR19_g5297 [Coniochaeta hoffmannii]|uniref:C2H2-type domain-containing protein n=1 Tax=Coniochaeta hoffmannii TaxID=91930 RepID=A0AA38S6Z4_9PEZI|nr:hypothetical protein NKR19_g5297 [Coniochaeta hoffmannii]